MFARAGRTGRTSHVNTWNVTFHIRLTRRSAPAFGTFFQYLSDDRVEEYVIQLYSIMSVGVRWQQNKLAVHLKCESNSGTP